MISQIFRDLFLMGIIQIGIHETDSHRFHLFRLQFFNDAC